MINNCLNLEISLISYQKAGIRNEDGTSYMNGFD